MPLRTAHGVCLLQRSRGTQVYDLLSRVAHVAAVAVDLAAQGFLLSGDPLEFVPGLRECRFHLFHGGAGRARARSDFALSVARPLSRFSASVSRSRVRSSSREVRCHAGSLRSSSSNRFS